jgi:aerobic-type carbon monoxide dehydrogenase small subunit (CoxS/CutS family)
MPDITPLPPAEGLHPTVEIRATVNGQTVVRSVPIHYRLIDFVREELKLTGNKEGCGAGECGTCSMFVDGKLVKSCLTPVQKVQGAVIETVDDLDRDHGMTVLQRAFHKCGASQCGYCIPGMVMAATSTLRRNPQASLDEIRAAASAATSAAAPATPRSSTPSSWPATCSTARVPATALLEDEVDRGQLHRPRQRAAARRTGQGHRQAARYAADLLDGRHAAPAVVLRSAAPACAHRIASIRAMRRVPCPASRCVLTSDDVPGVDGFGVFVARPAGHGPRQVVRYVGEAVAGRRCRTRWSIKRKRRVAAAMQSRLRGVARRARRSRTPRWKPGAVQSCTPTRPATSDEAHQDPQGRRRGRLSPKADLDRGAHLPDRRQVEHAYLEPEAGLAYVEARRRRSPIHSPSSEHHAPPSHAGARSWAKPGARRCAWS